jgi:hypothetical protein
LKIAVANGGRGKNQIVEKYKQHPRSDVASQMCHEYVSTPIFHKTIIQLSHECHEAPFTPRNDGAKIAADRRHAS